MKLPDRWCGIWIALILLIPGSVTAASDRPNIVFFLVDDMGWQETSVPFHSETTELNRRYRTPNMERLAAEGMKCDRRREQRLFLAVEKSPEIKRGRRHRCGCRRRSGEGSGGARVRSVPPLVRPCGGLSCGRICLR